MVTYPPDPLPFEGEGGIGGEIDKELFTTGSAEAVFLFYRADRGADMPVE